MKSAHVYEPEWELMGRLVDELTRQRPARRQARPQASAASSVISGTPASAFETGQPTFAASAAATNAVLVDTGHAARTVSAIFVIPSPGTNVTVADVSSCSAGRSRLRQPVGERHREARRVSGGDQLLRARLAVRLLGA